MSLSLGEIRFTISIVIGSITYWLGGWDILLNALLILMLVDYLTGVLKGICEKNLSSAIGFRGILRKVFMLAVVCVAFVLETIIGINFPLRELVVGFFLVNECISILENAAALQIPLPKKLVSTLNHLKNKQEDKDETDSSH